MSKERLAGLFQGSRYVYAMFGLPVPKWMESGMESTLSIRESLNPQPYNQTHMGKGQGQGQGQSTKAKGKADC